MLNCNNEPCCLPKCIAVQVLSVISQQYLREITLNISKSESQQVKIVLTGGDSDFLLHV